MSNPFFTADDDDVDDEEFLSNSRTGNRGYMMSGNSAYQGSSAGASGGHYGANQADPLQRLQEQKREIEQRTIDSSERSIGLLYESEKTGVATAEALNRQKEQLKRTEARLNDINSTLRSSERHLQGIKSVFGGIRNYFRGGPTVPAGGSGSSIKSGTSSPSVSANDIGDTYGQPPDQADRLDNLRESHHPGLRVQNRVEGEENFIRTSDQVNAMLDKNLEEMSLGLGRLKGLAQNLNKELDDHNDLIERIDNEAAIAGLKIDKQNKDMNKLLKK